MELTSERDDVKSRREQKWEEAQKSLSTIDKKHSCALPHQLFRGFGKRTSIQYLAKRSHGKFKDV